MAVPVEISYRALEEEPSSLLPQISKAFGSEPGCLGIIVIKGLPSEFPDLRSKLFHLIHRFANLPEEVRETVARPDNRYMFGWSHGKEVMNGRPDLMKGSYYANPLLDLPSVSEEQRRLHPEYYDGNVWPTDINGLEEFEQAFKALGKLIFQVGMALAKACEPFVATDLPDHTSISSLLANSQTHKARLLHYFPPSASASDGSLGEIDTSSDDKLANDALCGTHVDHSLLTGLCSAMYLNATEYGQPQQVPPPTKTAGLWIYPRHPPGTPQPDAIKVSIPPDCLGEALQLLTAGKLAATPHFVSGSISATPENRMISRETFAFFLQPDVDDIIGQDGETFGAFTKRVLGRHYAEAPKEAGD